MIVLTSLMSCATIVAMEAQMRRTTKIMVAALLVASFGCSGPGVVISGITYFDVPQTVSNADLKFVSSKVSEVTGYDVDTDATDAVLSVSWSDLDGPDGVYHPDVELIEISTEHNEDVGEKAAHMFTLAHELLHFLAQHHLQHRDDPHDYPWFVQYASRHDIPVAETAEMILWLSIKSYCQGL